MNKKLTSRFLLMFIVLVFLFSSTQALRKNTRFVKASSDGFWKEIDNGIPSGNSIRSIAISPKGIIYVCLEKKNKSGIFKSTDNGNSWKEADKGIPSQQLKLDIGPLAVTKDGTVFVAINIGGIFKSTDGGESWEESDKGIEDRAILSLATFSDNVIFEGSRADIFKSTNGGESWQKSDNGIENGQYSKYIYSIAIANKNLIYAGTEYGVFKSEDSGTTWKKTTLNDSTPYITTSKNGTVYAVTGNDIFKSTDEGRSWKEINNGLPHNMIMGISVSSNGVVYVATDDKGVFKSTDEGRSWKEINNGLPFIFISTMSISPNGTLYIGTKDGYMFKYTPTHTTTKIVLHPGSSYMMVNGVKQEIDPGRGTKPVIIPKWGRTVVPIRAIVEALGGAIEWDGLARKVTIEFNGKMIELWINNPKARVNGQTKWIDEKNHDVRPVIINSRTMLPLRFVVESLGCSVDWDPATKTITITYMSS